MVLPPIALVDSVVLVDDDSFSLPLGVAEFTEVDGQIEPLDHEERRLDEQSWVEVGVVRFVVGFEDREGLVGVKLRVRDKRVEFRKRFSLITSNTEYIDSSSMVV